MRVYRDKLHDRRVTFERNDETGHIDVYELDETDERQWKLGHLTDDELDERFEDDRYIPADDVAE